MSILEMCMYWTIHVLINSISIVSVSVMDSGIINQWRNEWMNEWMNEVLVLQAYSGNVSVTPHTKNILVRNYEGNKPLGK
jgi:hypothetical protein